MTILEYQNDIINKIDSYTIDSLPHSILLTGAVGSGFEYIYNYIATKFSLQQFNLTEISQEIVDQIYLMTDLSLYTLCVDSLSEKDQNMILKLFEEPNMFTYIILYGELTPKVLPTILNRSYQLAMKPYTRDFLNNIIGNCENKDLILDIANTPGLIEICKHTDIQGLNTLCKNIIENMTFASLANTLTIANKINFSDEYDKYDLTLFVRSLQHQLVNYNSTKCIAINKQLINFISNQGLMVYKKQYFEDLLINLWYISKEIER